MLKTRVIPTLLYKDFGLVKGVGFDSWRRVGTTLPAVKVYNMREVDELILLDIRATEEDRSTDLEMIAEIAPECFVPLTVGGGIRSLDEIREILRAGADKVAINSAAFEQPSLIVDASRRFGAQCVVASVDVRRSENGTYECCSHSGKKPRGIGPEEWARELERMGVGEILLTSIERDGTMQGYDLNLVEIVSRAVGIPVIASGGAGSAADMLEAIRHKASAVAAASVYHFTELTPLEVKHFLAGEGTAVRNMKVDSRIL